MKKKILKKKKNYINEKINIYEIITELSNDLNKKNEENKNLIKKKNYLTKIYI